MKGYKGHIKKKISIKLIGDAEKAFSELNKRVGVQKNKGIQSSKEIQSSNAIILDFNHLVIDLKFGF